MKRHLPVAACLILVPLVAACAGAPGSGSPRMGTVRGTVLLGPTCPVESLESPCPDMPAEGVEVQAIRGETVTATAVSGSDGGFAVDLEPGIYLLRAVVGPDGPGMSSQPTRVIVRAGAVANAVVFVDTGIRAPVGG